MTKTIKRASVSREGAKTIVRINSSAMSLMQTCQRKAKFSLFDSIEQPTGIAAQYGSLIHKALEKYYLLDPVDHTVDNITQIWSQVSSEWQDPEDSPHTKSTGAKILKNYAEKFAGDPWVAIIDSNGTPYAEVPFEFPIHSFEDVEVRLFGTIDLIVKNTLSRQISIMDHKTGRSLGAEFMNRWKPNNQMSAYVFAAREQFGFNCNSAIINGLQVAKTVQSVCRVETYRDQDELLEFKEIAIKNAIKLYNIYNGMDQAEPSDGSVCSQYGGCHYQQICALTPAIRQTALLNLKNEQSKESEYT